MNGMEQAQLVYSKHSINDLFPDIHLLTAVEHILTNSQAQCPNSFYLEAENKYKSTHYNLRTKLASYCRLNKKSVSCAVFKIGGYVEVNSMHLFFNICCISNKHWGENTFFSNTTMILDLWIVSS